MSVQSPPSSKQRSPKPAPSAPQTDEATASIAARAIEVHHRLCKEYGCPLHYFHDLDPLDELVSSMLSHRTLNKDSARAFHTLRERFASWEAVRDAPMQDVEQAITAATWPEQKAPRIQQVLREITERNNGNLSLDFLRDWPVEQARAWLEELNGVGPKTSAAVISFSALRGKALPVDSHHHRVAARLGLIPEGMPVGPAHRILEAQLPADWDSQQVYDNHQALMRHGKKVCTWRAPQCGRCVVLDLCPYGQAHYERGVQTTVEA